jgi:uncharacterized damage-inducible protein DinB
VTLTFRPGALGALMDEYERAIRDLTRILATLAPPAFEALRDRETADEDCRSIQTVLNHVVRSGYAYVGYMRTALGEDFQTPAFRVESPAAAIQELAGLAAVTAATFEGRWRMPDDEIESARIQSRWGPVFNLEQMFEHAIVHVLRHRRQIERFLSEPRFGETRIVH